MKFAEHLAAHITPEWRKQYIEYEEMKTMLYKAMETQISAEVADRETLIRYRTNVDEVFFKFCEKELNKINTFFAEKLAEATRKFANLQNELELIKHKSGPASGTSGLFKRLDIGLSSASRSKMHEMKLAFSEFYLSLVLLQNYQNLNYTGFRKIMKKHDKLFETETGGKWRQEHVDNAPFYSNKNIGSLIEDTENVFTSELEDGDRQKAMKRLRVPPLNDQQSSWVTFKVGFFSGAFIVLLVAVILTGLYRQRSTNDWKLVFRLYRGTFLVCLFMFLIGINVYGWKKSGVNHVLIFELDPRDHLSDQHLIEIASIFSVFWSLSLICYLYSDILSLPAVVHPLILVIGMLLFVLNPLPIFRANARFWLIRVFCRIAAAPFIRVAFADFWLADQINSLVPIFNDFQYFACFYASRISSGSWYDVRDETYCTRNRNMVWVRALLGCLPAWFRCAQCIRRWKDDNRGPFPHLVNAGKYATVFFVVIFATLTGEHHSSYVSSFENPFFILWIFSMCVSSVYSYVWDVRMDWGLFDANASKEYKCLREEIVYWSPNFYYFAIVEDFILRFAWTLSVSLTEVKITDPDLMMAILAPLEVFRRFIWNFFRLENEHLNNCGEFRAVRDISIAPINAGDQARIIKMMDEPDGVTNRKAKRRKVQSSSGRLSATRQNRFASIPTLTLNRNTFRSSRPEVKLLIERDRTPDASDSV